MPSLKWIFGINVKRIPCTFNDYYQPQHVHNINAPTDFSTSSIFYLYNFHILQTNWDMIYIWIFNALNHYMEHYIIYISRHYFFILYILFIYIALRKCRYCYLCYCLFACLFTLNHIDLSIYRTYSDVNHIVIGKLKLFFSFFCSFFCFVISIDIDTHTTYHSVLLLVRYFCRHRQTINLFMTIGLNGGDWLHIK